MSGEMKKPVNPNSPWRTSPTLPQTDKTTQTERHKQIEYAAKRLAKIDLDKQNEAKMRKREASHKTKTPEQIEAAEAIRLRKLREYAKSRRAKLREQRETAGLNELLQGGASIDRKLDERIVDL